ELVDEATAEPVAQLSLPRGADRHAEDRGAADEAELRRREGFRQVWIERAEDRKVDHVEEIAGRDQPDDLHMKRRNLRLVERFADEGFHCLCHCMVPPQVGRVCAVIIVPGQYVMRSNVW